jgi:6-phosphogluconolactonase
MSFRRAAGAAPSRQISPTRILLATVVILAGICLSCNNSNHGTPPPGPNHSAYVTLPADGSIGQVFIDGATGTMTLGAKTPSTLGVVPFGIALLPSNKFLYSVNARSNTISTFNVGSDGTLTQTSSSTSAGTGPNAAVIDPSGQFLLVTNSLSNDISVFSIDASSGALSEVAGSPVYANASPTQILFTHSGQYVYAVNPGIGMVTGFSFSAGVLTELPSSPVFSGAGAAALAVDSGDQYLYVANPSASNVQPYQNTIGNVSGFNIDSATGALTLMAGSPFASTEGTSGPTAITVDPGGRFVYAIAPGSSFSISCFAIDGATGQLTGATGSPFSVAGGGLFAIIDPVGNYLYIGSQTAGGIEGYTYNSSTGAPTVISGSPFVTGAPGSMVLSE